ncbi:hypothetical protein Gotur_013334 [Gossypium turneri]
MNFHLSELLRQAIYQCFRDFNINLSFI